MGYPACCKIALEIPERYTANTIILHKQESLFFRCFQELAVRTTAQLKFFVYSLLVFTRTAYTNEIYLGVTMLLEPCYFPRFVNS